MHILIAQYAECVIKLVNYNAYDIVKFIIKTDIVFLIG